MNYKKLSLDQRINLASQYALLLVADTRSTEEIIGILKKDCKLTEEQDAQAFAVMHTDYKAAYNSTVRRYKALGIMGSSLRVFLACYFIGKEMGSDGDFPMIFAIIFDMVA